MPSLLRLLVASLAGFASAAVVASAQAGVNPNSNPNAGCEALSKAFPSYRGPLVFYPDSEVYKWENSAAEFWSRVQILAPTCVFRPLTGGDVALAVRLLKDTSAPFALRSGGHMGIAGANNIDNGVLMVMSNMTSLYLSPDKTILSIGPAYRWGEVYKFLTKFGLSVPGGRLSPVGVPGLLLGGGINFYGNQRGFSADNVVEFEVVLADGSIVLANKDNNTDLFWGLKGGSSNFGLVVRFDVRTVPSKKVFAGIITVSSENVPALLAASAKYTANITDPKSHIIPATVATTRTPVDFIAAVILFYDSETDSNPACFKPFFDIPAISNTMAFKTVADFADETGTSVVPNINNIFASGTIVGKNYDELLKGIQITNEVFYSRLPLLYAQVPESEIQVVQLDWQPFGKLWIEASAKTGGNALGLDCSKIYVAYAEVVEWKSSQYDTICREWTKDTTDAIKNATIAAGFYDPWHYMGDSASFQVENFYDGYGQASKDKLLAISRKYDQSRLFQTLMPGGFKLGA
ncbi:related to 6-HYDROXY-D-NICOTINE OXIDASE [Rhynchosporium agropyri]|uniref:Related to 6-HYDROXY-D-NICOTINE OXIDASE n=1 Tax=Rhynchosporium agropyri TaxID=914238 RepID=A0A1E1JRG5_9HELO|nr:related to 6-HYDROXY-D-NICOTINE OXIDASE [Rhynchosporium agropyri]